MARLLLGGNADSEGGRSLSPEQNAFGDTSATNRAAAEALCNTYAGDSANVGWLTQYKVNCDFLIYLVWDDSDVVQRRNHAGTGWEDVTEVIQGRRGPGTTDVQVDATVGWSDALRHRAHKPGRACRRRRPTGHC